MRFNISRLAQINDHGKLSRLQCRDKQGGRGEPKREIDSIPIVDVHAEDRSTSLQVLDHMKSLGKLEAWIKYHVLFRLPENRNFLTV